MFKKFVEVLSSASFSPADINEWYSRVSLLASSLLKRWVKRTDKEFVVELKDGTVVKARFSVWVTAYNPIVGFVRRVLPLNCTGLSCLFRLDAGEIVLVLEVLRPWQNYESVVLSLWRGGSDLLEVPEGFDVRGVKRPLRVCCVACGGVTRCFVGCRGMRVSGGKVLLDEFVWDVRVSGRVLLVK